MEKNKLEKVAERQSWLEYNILGDDLDSRWFVYESFGGVRKFWQINLWDYLEIKHE